MKEKIKRWLLQLIYTKKSLRRKVRKVVFGEPIKGFVPKEPTLYTTEPKERLPFNEWSRKILSH
jgi:hypothetical protein